VGSCFAQGLAAGWKLPFRGIHHLKGHIGSVFLSSSNDRDENLAVSLAESSRALLPMHVLLVSGGHTQLMKVHAGLQVDVLARTLDDAAGECFDKCAKLLGLPYPGGAALEREASLSRPNQTRENWLASLPSRESKQDFSFSGLKSAVRRHIEKNPQCQSDPHARADLCWALQERITDVFLGTLKHWAQEIAESRKLAFCGGVSANRRIRGAIEQHCLDQGWELRVPPIKYCTDNAAMIAAAAWLQDPKHDLKDVQSRPEMS
jgi:N6-L-threonylcarbamoyladenine synthase